MPYRKNTIRKMTGPRSRKAARLINDLESTLTKLKNLMPQIESMEIDSIALYKRLSTFEKKAFQQEIQMNAVDLLPGQDEETPHTDTANPQTDSPLFEPPLEQFEDIR